MDEAVSIFIDKMGSPTEYTPVPSATIEYYKKILPERLLNYWQDYGWSAHAEGIFWMVNPAEYDGVVRSWLEDTEFEKKDNYYVIARTAFGGLYLWGEKTGHALKIESLLSRYCAQDLGTTEVNLDRESQIFFLAPSVEGSDFFSLFRRARRKLGLLKSDEMYGFVPALMLGGSEELENLEKVKIIEHLIFLSQLSPLKPFTLADI
ncbi:GAD-like domain-containing protein [Pseudomonas sp. 22-AL-CL-001]|uniref:GAD-like domain-containing protein n=1 Tax=Pseudomonas alabamensis TaxID=3064349 RepID=UPI00271262E7|nr:GAD-like domain-containing protein [Pseudomonas sp. 22-AL-CL-001]MDO7911133.1 GAD-like domain-containing protein [Pseudomonas sp. 22-AL-CL-001]